MASTTQLAQQWIELQAKLRTVRKQANTLKAEFDATASQLIQALVDEEDDQVTAPDGTVIELRERSVKQGYKAEWMSPAIEQYLNDAQGPPNSEEIVAAVFNARPASTVYGLHKLG